MKSIQKKLTVTTLLIFLMALSTLGGLNYWKAREIITGDITNSMQEEVKYAAGGIHDWLEACKLEVSGIAMAPVIRSGKLEEITSFLNYVYRENGRYESLAYVLPTGAAYNNLGIVTDISQREYFKQAISGQAAVSDPVVSKASGKMVTIVAVPVRSEGKVSGVLFGAISMDDVANKVFAIKAGQTGYAYVLQQDGTAMIHPDKEIAMKVNALTDSKLPQALRTVNEHIVSGEPGVASYEYAGAEKLVAYAPIAGVKWYLALNVPKNEITGMVSDLSRISLITIIVVLIVTGGLIAWYARRIAKPIQVLEAAAQRIAGGDISLAALAITSDDEIGRLGRSFEQMAQNLRTLIQKILGATEQVAASSQELTASSEQSALAANQIADSITEVSAGANTQMEAAGAASAVVEKMSVNIRKLAADANQVAEQSGQAAGKANEGDAAVGKVAAQMNQIEEAVMTSAQVVTKLGERSLEIGQIVDTISGIAGQTNLLALNAAIEAARAGEQGRGFAVVAEEVRKLAEQSQEAAKKIADLIGEIQTDTDKAVAAMDDGTRKVKTGTEVVNAAGTAFREIAVLVGKVSGQIKDISASMQEFAAGSSQIVDSVATIDELSKKSASESQSVSAAAEEQLASMEEIASSSQALSKLAQDLQAAVASFRV